VIDLSLAAQVALDAAREASELVMRVYKTPCEVAYKAKDDPVTRADREANALLCERLATAFPNVPIVAEESDPSSYAGFEAAPESWFVDPLDGTREFVARNGEFAVMIGLAREGRAKLGVIVAPTWQRAFVGMACEGAWEVSPGGARTAIRVSSRPLLDGASILVSRSHTPPGLASLVASVRAREAVVYGSSGLKAALVATGAHDVFLQPGPAGMRWDACASEALVVGAGGECTDADGRAFDYRTRDLSNARGLVATNGLLHNATIDALRASRSTPRIEATRETQRS
jgi:3'(2'), 5'-bisphosphate nucleotidase